MLFALVLQAVLKKHGVLFIVDEVITGFGRTGAKFGCDFYGIKPDLVTVAKAMSSSYYPLGAALLTERIADAVKEQAEKRGNFGHGCVDLPRQQQHFPASVLM